MFDQGRKRGRKPISKSGKVNIGLGVSKKEKSLEMIKSIMSSDEKSFNF